MLDCEEVLGCCPYTASALAAKVLADFDSYLPKFWQVIPPAEDNSPLTHPDAEATAAPEATTVASSSARARSGSRTGAPAVAMSAQEPSGSQFQIKDYGEGKSETLDGNYWGKQLDKNS